MSRPSAPSPPPCGLSPERQATSSPPPSLSFLASPASPPPPPRSPSPGSLGRRPQPPDSLHTRLRNENPQPRRRSQIIDLSRPASRTASRQPSGTSEDLAAPPGITTATTTGSSGGAGGAAHVGTAGNNSARQGRRAPDVYRAGSGSSHVAQGAHAFNDVASSRHHKDGRVAPSAAAARSEGRGHGELEGDEAGGPSVDIGILRDEVYDEYLGAWTAPVRRMLLKSLEWETPLLAWHQDLVRTPRLDRYFVYTSLLGTHSFFLIFLPIAFWLGNAYFGRGLINVLAFGVYLSSAIKDMLCVPRPYSPPVTRLTIGTHHLEYGFPSTHSTNSVSIALYLYLWLQALRNASPASAVAAELASKAGEVGSSLLHSRAWEVMLGVYAFSVVYGRVYAGMHSVVDCLSGSALGAAITLVQWWAFDYIEAFLKTPGFVVPLLTIPTGIFMVIVHPQPLDDCPCFEDAIAFIAVVMGIMNGRWLSLRYGLATAHDNPLEIPRESLPPWSRAAKLVEVVEPLVEAVTARGGGAAAAAGGQNFQAGAAALLLGSVVALAKALAMIVSGVAMILAVRVVVKTACQVVLPPTIRFAHHSLGLILPRRHYTSAASRSGWGTTAFGAESSPGATPEKALRHGAHEDGAAALAKASGRQTTMTTPTPTSQLRWRKEGIDASSNGFILSDGSGAEGPTSTGAGATAGSRERRPSMAHLRRHSGSVEGSKVKFGLSDGSTLPIPFTHPNAQLPGDALSERIAGALSAEERARQRTASTHAVPSAAAAAAAAARVDGVAGSDWPAAEGGGRGAADARADRGRGAQVGGASEGKVGGDGDGGPTSAQALATASGLPPASAWAGQPYDVMQSHAEQVRHHDADVLSKVTVYFSIGLSACALIPQVFSITGLST